MEQLLDELGRMAGRMGPGDVLILLALVLAQACWLEGLGCCLEGRRARLWWWLELACCAGAVALAWL